jgi:hypothetical protein
MEKEMSKHQIKQKIQTDARWACRAVLTLYNQQTQDEQYLRSTVHNNRMGFNGIDAPILSSIAQQLQAGRTMSQAQMAIIYRKVGKYAGQLHRLAYS